MGVLTSGFQPNQNGNPGIPFVTDQTKTPLAGVTGWETTTASLIGSLESRLSTQAGLQFFDSSDTALREPLRRGLFLGKVLRWPAFFDPKVAEIGKWLMEEQLRGVSGLPDNTLGRIEQSNGTVKLKSTFSGLYEQSGNTLSLKMPEYATSPLRKFLSYWLSGVSDKKIGITHFYGKKLRAVQFNKSCTFLYVLLGPTARPEDIEYACILHDCMPYTDKMAHLSSDIGEVGGEEIWDIEFAGTFDDGPEVNALARIVVEGYALYGESFMNSVLPAYMYNEIIKPAAANGGEAQMKALFSVAEEDRLAAAAADTTSGTNYTTDIGNVRNTFRQANKIQTLGEATAGVANTDGNTGLGPATEFVAS